MELSAIPLLSLCALLYGHTAKSTTGFSGAAAPAATIMLPAAVASAISPNLDLHPLTARHRPPAHGRALDRPPQWPAAPLPPHNVDWLR